MGGISLAKYSVCTSELDTAAQFQSQQREKPLSGCDLCELLLTPLTLGWGISFSGSSHFSPLMIRGSKLQKSRCSKLGPACSPSKVVSSLGRSHNPQVKLPWSEGIWLLKKKIYETAVLLWAFKRNTRKYAHTTLFHFLIIEWFWRKLFLTSRRLTRNPPKNNNLDIFKDY